MRPTLTILPLLLGLSLVVAASESIVTCSGDVSGNAANPPDRTIVPDPDHLPPYWMQLKTSVRPEKRYMHAMAYNSARKTTIVFGGNDASYNYLNDTWEFDGAWTSINTMHRPSPRWKTDLAFDPERKKIVLFGGENQNDHPAAKADTWEYDGHDWVQVFPANHPSMRYSHTMVWDDNIKAILLFSGAIENNPFYSYETWKYDGTDWTRIMTSVPPYYVCANGGMVFDEVRRKTYVYGGAVGSEYYTQMLEFDGMNWTEIHPLHNPGPLAFFGMTYDANSRMTVIFAGSPGIAMDSDKTWEFDGTDWKEIVTSEKPLARFDHKMVYDRHRKAVIMFGGARNLGWGLLDDTWVYVSAVDTSAPSIAGIPLIAVFLIISTILLISQFRRRLHLSGRFIWPKSARKDQVPNSPSSNFGTLKMDQG